MAELKTKPNKLSVEKFLNSIKDEQKRQDSFAILEMMKKITREDPIMWGPSIVGFGKYHYKYASGREGNWFLTGFSPRKQSFTIYTMTYVEKHKDLLKKLGKFKTGKGCLYINKLEDVDMNVLKELITTTVKKLK